MPSPHRTLRGTSLLALLLAVGGCASARVGAPSVAPDAMGAAFLETGTFRFEVRAKSEVISEGWINVTRDTIVVRATPGPCSYERQARNDRRIVYTCPGRTFSFDRRRPVTRAWLIYPQRVVTTRQVCGNWDVNARGVRVCTRTEPETVERFVPTSVRLQAIRP